MPNDSDLEKLERTVHAQERQILALANAIDELNGRLAASVAFVTALPNAAEVEKERAEQHLGARRMKKLGNSFRSPRHIAGRELDSLQAEAKAAAKAPQATDERKSA
jgi:hypothetical protein